MALLIPVISGPVSCTSLNTYGSQRLSPSVLFFVDFLMPFPKAVRLFVSVRQESRGFSLCQLSDIQPLSEFLRVDGFLSRQEVSYVFVGFNFWAPSHLSGVRDRAFVID